MNENVVVCRVLRELSKAYVSVRTRSFFASPLIVIVTVILPERRGAASEGTSCRPVE